MWSWFCGFVQTDHILTHHHLDPKARITSGDKRVSRDTTTAAMKAKTIRSRRLALPILRGARRVPRGAQSVHRSGQDALEIDETTGPRRHVALLASHDHVTPRSWGGTDTFDNVVTACWPYQFARLNGRLEDCRLEDPSTHDPVSDGWDGLTRLLTKPSEPT